mmetsp:Transcript_52764/g.141322  ORF Transcript_52764/g.141322 Transcript_52764/m.141322 type:complete len:101 (-) Transcript_52764:106-408(-)
MKNRITIFKAELEISFRKMRHECINDPEKSEPQYYVYFKPTLHNLFAAVCVAVICNSFNALFSSFEAHGFAEVLHARLRDEQPVHVSFAEHIAQLDMLVT